MKKTDQIEQSLPESVSVLSYSISWDHPACVLAQIEGHIARLACPASAQIRSRAVMQSSCRLNVVYSQYIGSKEDCANNSLLHNYFQSAITNRDTHIRRQKNHRSR